MSTAALFRLALRNILRQKQRSLMMLAAIVSGVVGMMLVAGFIHDVYHQFGEGLIRGYTGNFQIARKGFFEFGYRTPEGYLLEKPSGLLKQIAATPGVTGVSPRLDFSAMLNNGSAEVPITGEGVDAAMDAKFGSWLRIVDGRALTENDRDAVLVGKGVARALKLKANDRVTLLLSTAGGAMNTMDLTVAGVFTTVSKEYDDHAIRLPLATAQEQLATDAISRAVVYVAERDASTPLARQVVASLGPAQFESRTWFELSEAYQKTVAAYEGQFGVIRIIVLLMVVLSVANIVNMSILERNGEFGTMRAMGNSNSLIFSMILIESAVIGIVGAIVGLALGVVVALIVSAIGIPMPPPPGAYEGYLAQIRLSYGEAWKAVLTGLIAPLPASLWPAWRVTRTPIVDALREMI